MAVRPATDGLAATVKTNSLKTGSLSPIQIGIKLDEVAVLYDAV
jgi:hypothetical protein